MTNITSVLAAVALLHPQSLTASGSTLILDRFSYEAAAILLQIGALTGTHDVSNKLAFVAEESATTAAVDFTTIAAGGILITTLPTIDAAGKASKAYWVEFLKTKRYVRLTFTETGTAQVLASALGVLGAPRHAPVPAPAVGITAT